MENNKTLEELILNYFENKQLEDRYKKLASGENSAIKSIMLDNGQTEYSVSGLVAKIGTQDRSTFNEDKLLKVIRNWDNDNISGIIKTKEYIDFDALEDAIYNECIDSDTIDMISQCKEEHIVYTLKVTDTTKKKKEK